MTDPKRSPTTFRLDPELRDRLDSFAERTQRSLNGAVNFIVREFLDADDRRREEREEQP